LPVCFGKTLSLLAALIVSMDITIPRPAFADPADAELYELLSSTVSGLTWLSDFAEIKETKSKKGTTYKIALIKGSFAREGWRLSCRIGGYKPVIQVAKEEFTIKVIVLSEISTLICWSSTEDASERELAKVKIFYPHFNRSIKSYEKLMVKEEERQDVVELYRRRSPQNPDVTWGQNILERIPRTVSGTELKTAVIAGSHRAQNGSLTCRVQGFKKAIIQKRVLKFGVLMLNPLTFIDCGAKDKSKPTERLLLEYSGFSEIPDVEIEPITDELIAPEENQERFYYLMAGLGVSYLDYQESRLAVISQSNLKLTVGGGLMYSAHRLDLEIRGDVLGAGNGPGKTKNADVMVSYHYLASSLEALSFGQGPALLGIGAALNYHHMVVAEQAFGFDHLSSLGVLGTLQIPLGLENSITVYTVYAPIPKPVAKEFKAGHREWILGEKMLLAIDGGHSLEWGLSFRTTKMAHHEEFGEVEGHSQELVLTGGYRY
jgi:hypothetical protein